MVVAVAAAAKQHLEQAVDHNKHNLVEQAHLEDGAAVGAGPKVEELIKL